MHTSGKHNLGWCDSSTRVVYVQLTYFVEGYEVQNDKDGFKLL